jgi:hypothetical protein
MNLVEAENLLLLAGKPFRVGQELTEELPANILGNELGTFRDELYGDGKPPTVRKS